MSVWIVFEDHSYDESESLVSVFSSEENAIGIKQQLMSHISDETKKYLNYKIEKYVVDEIPEELEFLIVKTKSANKK